MTIDTRTRVRRRPWLGAAVFLLVALLVALEWPDQHGRGAIYGIALFAVLSLKLTASVKHAPSREAPPRRDIAVVVPYYNEDPEILALCLDSILAQTYRPSHVVVIDDGSTDLRAGSEMAGWEERFGTAGIAFTAISFEENKGKREALVAGFRTAPTAWAYLCVDSDTRLEPRALHEVMRPFADPTVTCATGLVIASNWRRNVLTRLIDLRYTNAFLFERAAYSALGSVLCACGSLAVYRADVVHKYADDFLNQKFLGQKAIFGDDRRLTNYSLLEGRAVLQETAIASTAVPERLSHYVRQQVRWNKSFFRESLWAIRNLDRRRPAVWLTLVELTSWVVFTGMLFAATIVSPIRTGQVMLLTYASYLVLVGYARSVRYFEVRRKGVRRWEVAGTFLLAPLYGLLHMGLLMPLRLYSLATLHRGGWGTRKTVEVGLSRLTQVGLVGGLIGRPEPITALAREAAASGRGTLTVLPPKRGTAGSPAPVARHRKATADHALGLIMRLG
jgi:hyaluronan synthase